VHAPRLVVSLAALLVVAAVGASTATAATITKTVPGEYVFAHAADPADAGHCSAIIFAKWTDVPGTISATARFTALRNASWGEHTESREAPFDDTFTFAGPTYVVPPGQHWIAIGKGWSDGPRPNDCSEMSARQPGFYKPPVTVDLTIEEPAACTNARTKVTSGTKAVASLKTKVQNASGDRKKALRKKLKAAKNELKKAKNGVKKHCP